MKIWIVFYLRTKLKFFFFLVINNYNFFAEITQPILPITTQKHKNLFCQASKNVGSYRRVFNVFLLDCDRQNRTLVCVTVVRHTLVSHATPLTPSLRKLSTPPQITTTNQRAV